MSLLSNLREKRAERFATATPATIATPSGERGRTVASVATVTVAKLTEGQTAPRPPVGAGDTPSIAANADAVTPFDLESFEERAAIAEFAGGLDRGAAESLAWEEDNRRRCTQCTKRRPYDGVCKVAATIKGALVIANRSYTPDPVQLWRCEGYTPKAGDSDQRTGVERWPGLMEVAK